ncbi:MAG: chlorophyll a/b-binding protein [Cyanobacteria bacterium J06626_6]
MKEDKLKSADLGSNAAVTALNNKTLGVSATQYYKPEPRLGFTPYAELWNGRLAMVGFVIALIFELISSHAL